MRMILISAVLLAGGVAAAAPAPPAPPAPPGPAQEPAARRGEVAAFARQTFYLCNQVIAAYAEPLPPEDVYEAALAGLYRAARKPVPRDLRAQVRRAINLATALRDESSPDALVKPGDDPREELIAAVRESIGAALSGPAALRAAARGIAGRLDEHSGLVTVEEQRRSAGLDRLCVGAGLELADGAGLGPTKVEAVHLGGPAQQAGMRPGDVITHVDGTAIESVAPEKLVLLRSGRVLDAPTQVLPPDAAPPPEPGPATLELTYRRPGEERERTAVIALQRFRPESVLGVRRDDANRWDYWLDEKGRLAYLRITSLSRGTAEDLRAALESLRESKVRGLVLDLRWCPGGYLREAVECADLFLGNAIVTTERSRGHPDVPYRSAEGDKFLDFPLVVLVNGESVGGAELIAAALQDHQRAVVVGQRTRGKGSVQELLEVSDGLALKLTKGAFVRPSGKGLHRRAGAGPADEWGVVPDEDCRVSPQLSKRLREWHQEYALRPGASNERLMLDDPAADPQRMAAAAALRRALGER